MKTKMPTIEELKEAKLEREKARIIAELKKDIPESWPLDEKLFRAYVSGGCAGGMDSEAFNDCLNFSEDFE